VNASASLLYGSCLLSSLVLDGLLVTVIQLGFWLEEMKNA